jgi:hypothetical protein
VWFRETLSTLPLECLISAFTGWNIKQEHIHVIHYLILFKPSSSWAQNNSEQMTVKSHIPICTFLTQPKVKVKLSMCLTN